MAVRYGSIPLRFPEVNLLVVAFGGQIRRHDLDAERDDVLSDSVLYDHPGGGVLAMGRLKTGQVFFSDTTGIFRLTP
jgi:hypothetical protein